MTRPSAPSPELSADVRQVAYAAHRAAMRVQFEALAAAGAFKAPFDGGLAGRQAELGLPEPLRADDSQAEAA